MGRALIHLRDDQIIASRVHRTDAKVTDLGRRDVRRDLDWIRRVGRVDDEDAVAGAAREHVRPLPRQHPSRVVVVAAVDAGELDLARRRGIQRIREVEELQPRGRRHDQEVFAVDHRDRHGVQLTQVGGLGCAVQGVLQHGLARIADVVGVERAGRLAAVERPHDDQVPVQHERGVAAVGTGRELGRAIAPEERDGLLELGLGVGQVAKRNGLGHLRKADSPYTHRGGYCGTTHSQASTRH